jgi:hypothetical protein
MITYFVRADSLRFEARGEKLLTYLDAHGEEPLMAAVVKEPYNFKFNSIQKIHNGGPKWMPQVLRHVLKFIVIQLFFLRVLFKKRQKISYIIIANYEFLPIALVLGPLIKIPIYVDLHEHYFTDLLASPRVANFVFTRWLNGVIFANQSRADDLLGPYSRGSRVSVVRNFPDVATESVETRAKVAGSKIKVTIVGNIAPGRFVEQSIRSLDDFEFAESIEIHLFGSFPDFELTHVSLINHGRFNHEDIDRLISEMDVSLVFYDPSYSKNFLMCEPNRFFQAYNAGNKIVCFEHPSLYEFYDAAVRIIDTQEFEDDLKDSVRDFVKIFNSHAGYVHQKRKKLTFNEGVTGLMQRKYCSFEDDTG